jgi:hypothetical protein
VLLHLLWIDTRFSRLRAFTPSRRGVSRVTSPAWIEPGFRAFASLRLCAFTPWREPRYFTVWIDPGFRAFTPWREPRYFTRMD